MAQLHLDASKYKQKKDIAMAGIDKIRTLRTILIIHC